MESHDTSQSSAAAGTEGAGRHAATLQDLEAAAARGDVEALTRLGKRLLVAAGSDPMRGTELVFKAANLGGAEAAAQVATLSALGMYAKQSWDTALAALVFAAERGWPAARGQLGVLAEDRGLVESASGASEPDAAVWGRLARTIDLRRWHEPTAGRNLSETPLVRYFPEFVSAPVCDWLIAGARGRLVRAEVYDALARKRTTSETRNNTWAVFNVTHSDVVSVLVQVHICANTGVPIRHLEPATVLHYATGEEISEHYDFVDPNVPNYAEEIARNGQRIVTFLVYLNDDYEGGATELPRLGLSHKAKRGEALFFVNALENGEADTRTLHAGRPPTHGEKWIVSQFIRNRPTF